MGERGEGRKREVMEDMCSGGGGEDCGRGKGWLGRKEGKSSEKLREGGKVNEMKGRAAVLQ